MFWIDSSARFLSGNLSGLLNKFVWNRGIMTFGYSSHKIFPATHEGMYRYLPIPLEKATSVEMLDANSVLFYRTRKIYNSIVRWWTACALVHDCIASSHNRFCGFHKDRDHTYANCHRFDQSALNILMANHYRYNISSYLYQASPVTTISRGSQGVEELIICPPGGGPRRSEKSHSYFK